MPSVELSAGTIEYADTGGDGPPFVLLHGLVMDGALWREVVDELDSEPRCVMPTLPFGAHRVPMHPDADLSLRGVGRIVAELLERSSSRRDAVLQRLGRRPGDDRRRADAARRAAGA